MYFGQYELMYATTLRFIEQSFNWKRAVFKTEARMTVEVHGC
jgi:hypothetical protein